MTNTLITPVTDHALIRMQQRRAAELHVDLAIDYGREIHSRDAIIYFIGSSEVQRYQRYTDLSDLNGLHVVCSKTGVVITVYRNKEFKRKRFSNKRRHHSQSPSKVQS